MEYFSKIYNISLKGDEDWFDPRLDRDTPLFIDPFFVFKSDLSYFKDSRDKFMRFFHTAFGLATEVKIIRSAYNKLKNTLKFPEVPEICLGFSEEDISGSGAGGNFATAFADALVSLVEENVYELEHFEVIEIFTPGIAHDGISDTTANIIKRELISYTQDICAKLDIPMVDCVIDNAEFDFKFERWETKRFSLPRNPLYEDRAVILVPKEFLVSAPVISREGFTNYIKSNKAQELRTNLNYEIEKNFTKSVIVDIAKKRRTWIDEYVDFVKNTDISPYDIEIDPKNVYRNKKRGHEFAISNPLQLSASNYDEFLAVIKMIIEKFKLYVEYQGGYTLLWDRIPKELSTTGKEEWKSRNETSVQTLFTGIVLSYCQANNVDLSKEADIGRGGIDFKFSTGYTNRALVEFKLARSTKLKQGALKQLPAYLKCEQVNYGYYAVIVYEKKEFKILQKAREDIEPIFENSEVKLEIIDIDATFDKPSGSNL